MNNNDQRPPRKQERFGILGFGKDPTNYTTIFTIVAIVNWILFLYHFSLLGTKDAEGNFRISTELPETVFFVFGGIVIMICLVDSFFIRYHDAEAKWSGRFFASYLPALITGYFIWSKLNP